MPAPSTYSESDLAAYMLDIMGQVATDLGWTASTPAMVRAIYATERACAVTDIATATDMGMVEAIAAREAWRVAARWTATLHNFGPQQGVSFAMSAINDQITTQLAFAEAAASIYGDPANTIVVSDIVHADDPYAPLNLGAEMG